jgi:hypothetical protein
MNENAGLVEYVHRVGIIHDCCAVVHLPSACGSFDALSRCLFVFYHSPPESHINQFGGIEAHFFDPACCLIWPRMFSHRWPEKTDVAVYNFRHSFLTDF